jgi:CO/xanthine dehydrogenase FAD-binding subunit
LEPLEEGASDMNDVHPGLPQFDYIKPETLHQASQFLASHIGEARPLLGGTDIFVRMRDGVWRDRYLVDVKEFDGMQEICYDPVKGLSIGAGVNMNKAIASFDIQKHYAVLAEAARSVASYQLRNRATIVGNICNASPAGDTIGACILLGGELEVHGIGGYRRYTLAEFFRAPGVTALEPGDIVVKLHLPPAPKGLVGRYIKLGRNKASDLSIVGVTAVGYPDDTNVSGFRIKLALASVAPVPLIVEQVEELLAGVTINQNVLDESAQIAMQACSPIDDTRASAQYRKLMVRNLSLKALMEVWNALSGQGVEGGFYG